MKNIKIMDSFYKLVGKIKLYKESIGEKKVSLIINSTSPKVVKAMDDFEKNHNWTWYDETYDRNKENLDDVALWYRGTEITYREMFDKANKLALSLKKYGIKKGDTVPACIKNTPELVYLMLATSKIGAKINIFGPGFEKDYITEIINGTNSTILFAETEEYELIKDCVEKSNIKYKVLYSLKDSMDNHINPYEESDLKYLQPVQEINEMKQSDSTIMSMDDFMDYGKDFVSQDNGVGSIDDDFIITYTSGSTNSSRPKQIVHKNRSLTVMGRFHADDLSGLPSTKHTRTMAHIPPYSNTDLITSISDTLYQRGTITLEPIYEKDHFLESIIINKPNFAPATCCFYLDAAKKILFDEKYKDLLLPDLYIPTVVGEAMSAGEEYFINEALKKVKAGSGKIPFPVSPVKLSFGGGDCEHGGLFFTLYRDLLKKISLSKDEYGLKPFALADVAVLDKDKKPVPIGEMGELVSKSQVTMKEYLNNEEATKNFFFTDSNGVEWGKNNTWAYIDKGNRVHIKGRIGSEFTLTNGEKIPYFMLSDIVLADKKNVLTCVISSDETNGSRKIIVHVEINPLSRLSTFDVLRRVDESLEKNIPNELYKDLVYRVHSFAEGFPVNGSGKRDHLKVLSENDPSKWFRIIRTGNSATIVPYLSSQVLDQDTLDEYDDTYKKIR